MKNILKLLRSGAVLIDAEGNNHNVSVSTIASDGVVLEFKEDKQFFSFKELLLKTA